MDYCEHSARGGHVREAHIHLMKQTHSAGHVTFAHTLVVVVGGGVQIINILVHLVQPTKLKKIVQNDGEDEK